jgi:glycosyltransferase involved in cell wall biosynthesis
MRIIHLFDHLNKGNMGILKTTSDLSLALNKDHGTTSELWFPQHQNAIADQAYGLELVPLEDTHWRRLEQQAIKAESTLVMSHGCWNYPTRWGHLLHKMGCRWIYTPHGMLEPWSRKQKWLKKWLYFRAIEQRLASCADLIRAVSQPERVHLQQLFPKKQVTLIHYGLDSKQVPSQLLADFQDCSRPTTVLFMARLHHKKGIVPLLEGWCRSRLYQNPNYELAIAGFDDGALPQIQRILSSLQSPNIRYIGAVFGSEKAQVLARSSFYILPSHSEGLPTSVLEAMQYGLVPLISDGCNLPEALAAGIALLCNPDPDAIARVLNTLPTLSPSELQRRRREAQDFVTTHFSVQKTAAQFIELLSEPKKP